MRYFVAAIILAFFGCDASTALPIPLPPAGALTLSLGQARVIIAPVGSATAGSKWLEVPVTYTNVSGQSLWVDGYSASMPFFGMETRDGANDPWTEYPTGHCGTGASAHEIAPGASYTFNVDLPQQYESREFRVLLRYRTDPAGVSTEAQSAGRVLRERPAAQ